VSDPWWYGLGSSALLGLGWWVAALVAAIPYRRRAGPWIRWLRLTVGLPLALGGALEAARSRTGLARRTRLPYRGFVPFAWALAVAEAVTLTLGLLVRLSARL